MTDMSGADKQLLRSILKSAETLDKSGQPSIHVDEEVVAMFVDGDLKGQELAQFLQHLDGCADCRQLAASLLSEEPIFYGRISPDNRTRSSTNRILAMSAALILVAVTIWAVFPLRSADQVVAEETYRSASQLLAASNFDQATTMLENAREKGAWSPALMSLEAQVIRRIPSELSLSIEGRLTDFGYDLGGVAPRSVIEDEGGRLHSAESVLVGAGDKDLRVVLNRGHLQLSLRHIKEAQREFETAVKLAPRETLAWLGLGLAQFMSDNLSDADQSFRHCLAIDSHHIAAKMNLAMTREEAGNPTGALEIWKSLQAEILTEKDRAKVNQAIQLLEDSKP